MAILDPAAALGGCLTVEDIRSLIGSRLHLIEPLRWRLRAVPLGLDLPYWADSATPGWCRSAWVSGGMPSSSRI